MRPAAGNYADVGGPRSRPGPRQSRPAAENNVIRTIELDDFFDLILTVLTIWLGIKIYRYIGLKRSTFTVDRTPRDIAETIEGFLDGSIGDREWHDFACHPITDRSLDDVRRQCAAVPLWQEPDCHRVPCDEEGRAVLQRLALQMRFRDN